MGTMLGNKLLEGLPKGANGGLSIAAVRGMDTQEIEPDGGRANRNHNVLRGGEALYNIIGTHGKLLSSTIAKRARNPNLATMGGLTRNTP